MNKLPLKMALLIVAMATTTLLLPSCKKEKEPTPIAQNGDMKVKFDFVFGSNMLPWNIGKTMVHTKTGDTLIFTLFKFYVSNVKLKDANGNWWSAPNSYYLLCTDCEEGYSFTVKNVPAGNYTEMQYTMGVDSAANTLGASTGALSLVHGMFWDWNSGYIMLKAEGTSPNSPSGNFIFHLGGFMGADNVITVKSTNFDGAVLGIEKDKQPTVTLLANPAKLWHSSPSVSVKSVIHAPGPEAVVMAKDFYNNIAFKALEQ